MGFAAGLVAATALMAAAQMTPGYPGLGGSAVDSGVGSGGAGPPPGVSR
jgi:hypothetical protein